MERNVIVSIIIPVYNAEKYLQQCLESVINQTYPTLDIILLDDGSEDSSLQICKRLADCDDRVRVYHRENRGVSTTRNEGIDLANGNYIVFVDADDMIDVDMIESMVISARKNYLTTCLLEEFTSEVLAKSTYRECEIKELNINAFWSMFEMGTIHSPCNKLYESTVIKQAIRFKEGLSLGEDLLFNLEYLKHMEGFVFLDRAFYHYRATGNQSLSHKYYPDGFEIQLYLYKELCSFCKTQIEMSEEEWRGLYWCFFKALQGSLDAEFEFGNCVKTEKLFEKMQREEFLEVFQRVYQCRKQYRMVSRLEIFLYKHKLWELDYKLRKLRRK